MGLIALDIDGTVTMQPRHIPQSIVDYLSRLYAEGWSIAFVTGRTYNQCFQALEKMPFPFFLAVQNGAIILSMPDHHVLFKHYLEKETLLVMSAISERNSSDVVVYSGYEFNDRSYYRPAAFHPPLTDYLVKRCAGYNEKWTSLESFSDLPIPCFPSTKSFGSMERLLPISVAFERDLGLHAPINRDPFQDGYYVLQTTHAIVSKGRVVDDLRQRSLGYDVVIAAGDDLNDESLLHAADIKIVMANAPKQLLDIADVIAPPATEEGIIIGLSQAIAKMKR